LAAKIAGVQPSPSSKLTAAPALSKASTILKSPFCEALWSAVIPSSVAKSTFAPFLSKTSTTSKYPYSEAIWSAVIP